MTKTDLLLFRVSLWAGLAATILPSRPAAGAPVPDPVARAVNTPETASANSFYLGNRQPLRPSPFIKLPIGAIVPRGWLRHQLELEANGMTGHLEEISKWCKFQDSAWAAADGQGEFNWE